MRCSTTLSPRLVIALSVCMLLSWRVAQAEDGTPQFAPIRVVPPFPAIVDAPFIEGAAVTDQVTAKELVLGVVIDGEARACPINMLTGPQREIINDRLGGRAIAATW
jgi:hypothetical protein